MKLIFKIVSLVILYTMVSGVALSQAPSSWAVSPGSYSNTYSVTARANHQCVDLNSTGNVIAAFVNGQCRAVKNTNVSNGTSMLALLPIKSNTNGEKVYFKLYDSTNNVVYDLLDTLVFNAGGSNGTIGNPYIMYTNHPITDILLDTLEVSEGLSVGNFITNISVEDVDLPYVATYSLTPSYGDNLNVSITSNLLNLNRSINFNIDSTLELEINAIDTGGCSFTKQFVMKIIDVDYSPIAINDTTTTNEDTAVNIIVLANDTDRDFNIDSSSVLAIGGGNNGTISIDNNGVILYTPNADYYGIDSIIYQVCDLTQPTPLCDTATVYITINPINDTPIAINDTVLVIEDSLYNLSVYINDTDADNNLNLSTVSITTPPVNGTASLSGTGEILYLPDPFYNGFDSLYYAICDSTSLCDTAVLYINVIPVPNAPIDIIIDTLFVKENNPNYFRISTIKTVDTDPYDSFIYDLVNGIGDEDNGQFEIIDSSLYLITKTNFDIKTEYYFRIRTTDFFNLYYEKSFVLKVQDVEGIEIPLPSTNFISPNNDGKNDYWKVDNIEIYNEFNLNIFDQYGHVIYSVENNYNNDWDGTFNGEPLPTGNYYYIFRNENKMYKGNITIVNK